MGRIVILEDEQDIAFLYEATLEAEGHEVLGVFESPEAVLARYADPGATPPDLIILDERLGPVSGTQYLPKLREALPEVRILLATADPSVIANVEQLGADEAKEKPFTLDHLVANVAELLG